MEGVKWISIEFLNVLYKQQSEILKEMDRLSKISTQPRPYCQKCKSGCNEDSARLVIIKQGLNATDKLIEEYIRNHSQPIINP